MNTNQPDPALDAPIAPATPDAPAAPPTTALALAVPSKDAAFIEAIVRADTTPTQIAAEFGLSFNDLIAWSDRADLTDAVHRMCVLNLHQMRVILTRFATSAAVSLLRMATREQSDPPAEVARKSCVDLLDVVRAAVGASGSATLSAEHRPTAVGEIAITPGSRIAATSPSSATGPRGPSEDTILRALELIDEQHQREPQQPWRSGDPTLNTEPSRNG